MRIDDITKVIRNIDINLLIPDENNPNEMSEKEIKQLGKSIDKYGFVYPLVIDQNNKIIDGHHRYNIYKERGFKEVPCIKMKFDNDAQRRALRQTLYRVHGNHDLAKDIKELEAIMSQESDLLYDLLEIDNNYIDELKKGLQLIEPKFKIPKGENTKDVMDAIGIKKVIHIPVSEELIEKMDNIMESNDISDYEELLEFLVDKIE